MFMTTKVPPPGKLSMKLKPNTSKQKTVFGPQSSIVRIPYPLACKCLLYCCLWHIVLCVLFQLVILHSSQNVSYVICGFFHHFMVSPFSLKHVFWAPQTSRKCVLLSYQKQVWVPLLHNCSMYFVLLIPYSSQIMSNSYYHFFKKRSITCWFLRSNTYLIVPSTQMHGIY